MAKTDPKMAPWPPHTCWHCKAQDMREAGEYYECESCGASTSPPIVRIVPVAFPSSGPDNADLGLRR